MGTQSPRDHISGPLCTYLEVDPIRVLVVADAFTWEGSSVADGGVGIEPAGPGGVIENAGAEGEDEILRDQAADEEEAVARGEVAKAAGVGKKRGCVLEAGGDHTACGFHAVQPRQRSHFQEARSTCCSAASMR